ncbi:MAG TPA: hypothetical protein VJC18_09430 [bacterium]|nr:hypothetical protein [bacterium]
MFQNAMSKQFKNIYILGGHELAYSYYQKILQAKKEGRIACENLLFVTPDPQCHAAVALKKENLIPQNFLIQKKYTDFILDCVGCDQNWHNENRVIPDHTAGHVLLRVLMDLAPGYSVRLSPIELAIGTPFLKKFEQDAIWAMSFATWTCPMYCDEPALCPHTKEPRTGDLNEMCFAKENSFSQVRAGVFERANAVLYSFACQPLIDEIVSFDFAPLTGQINDYRHRIATGVLRKVYVFTHSHCHGILGCFVCGLGR